MERARECAGEGRRERMSVEEQVNVKARRRNMITGKRGECNGAGKEGSGERSGVRQEESLSRSRLLLQPNP